MNAAKRLTSFELAERWRICVKKGAKANQLNLEYVHEKARKKIWPAIRPPGSRYWLFDLAWVEAVENGALALPDRPKLRSLKIEKNPKVEARSQRKERRWA